MRICRGGLPPAILCLSLALNGCQLVGGAFQWPFWVFHAAERIPFTHDLRERYRLDAEDLRALQYYLAVPVVLTREVAAGDTLIAGGRLVRRAGKYIEEVRIEAGTPGVALAVGENWLDISFAQDTTLRFGSDPERRAHWEGRYSLLGGGWETGAGFVPFAGQTYVAAEGSGGAYLLITKQFLYDQRENRQTLPGRRVTAPQ